MYKFFLLFNKLTFKSCLDFRLPFWSCYHSHPSIGTVSFTNISQKENKVSPQLASPCIFNCLVISPQSSVPILEMNFFSKPWNVGISQWSVLGSLSYHSVFSCNRLFTTSFISIFLYANCNTDLLLKFRCTTPFSLLGCLLGSSIQIQQILQVQNWTHDLPMIFLKAEAHSLFLCSQPSTQSIMH